MSDSNWKSVIKSKAKQNETPLTGYKQANLVCFNDNMKLQFGITKLLKWKVLMCHYILVIILD